MPCAESAHRLGLESIGLRHYDVMEILEAVVDFFKQ
jgi:hypothetical protein